MTKIHQEPRTVFKNDTKKKLKALGINIYGGGFTLGVLKHFHVLGQWEEFKLGHRTFALNFPDIDRPHDALMAQDYKLWPTKKFIDAPDFVYANPPCVPWSSASSFAERTGQVGTRFGKTIAHRFEDPLLQLTHHTMDTAIALRPKVFISESVENGYNIGKSFYDELAKRWMKKGYSVTYFLTDAVIHGSPCRRRRFHFCAHRVDLKLPPPPNMKDFQATTVKDAIWDLRKRKLVDDGDLQHIASRMGRWGEAKYVKIMKSLPPLGLLVRNLPENFDGPRPGILVRRLDWRIPAPTIVGFHNSIHPDGERALTFREGMRIMTYPDEFRIAGHCQIDAYDAVIPLIADLLAKTAKRSIEADEKVKKPELTTVDWRPLGEGYSGKAAMKRLGLLGKAA